MSVNTNTIAKNISVLMMSQVATWTLTFVLTIFLPRYLGPTSVGQFYIALSTWTIIGMLARFGTDVYLAKAIARDPSRISELLSVTLLVRTLLFALGCGLAALYISRLGFSGEVAYLTSVIALATLAELWAGAFTGTLQGLESMEYFSIATVAGKFVYTTSCLTALFMGYGVFTVAWLYSLGTITTFIILAFFFIRRYRPRFQLSLSDCWKTLRAGLPYVMGSLMVVFYNEVDKQVIAAFIDPEAVGWYTTAATLYSTVMFIPVAFTSALLPSLARSHTDATDALPRIVQKSFDIMFILGVPVGLGISAISHSLIGLIYGPEFAPAGEILSVLGIVIISVYLNILFSQILIATDRPNRWTVVMVGSTIVTLLLDMMLIPWFERTFGNGALAGAGTYLVVEAAQAMIGIWMLRKLFAWSNVRVAVLTLLAGLLMFGACWLVRDMFILVPVIVGGLVYVSAILLMRVVPAEDFTMLKGFGQQAIGRIRTRVSPASAR